MILALDVMFNIEACWAHVQQLPAIDNVFPHFQTLLRELEFKKPQLDELVNSAESLKAADANKIQLQTKGECVKILQIDKCWVLYMIW